MDWLKRNQNCSKVARPFQKYLWKDRNFQVRLILHLICSELRLIFVLSLVKNWKYLLKKQYTVGVESWRNLEIEKSMRFPKGTSLKGHWSYTQSRNFPVNLQDPLFTTTTTVGCGGRHKKQTPASFCLSRFATRVVVCPSVPGVEREITNA